MDAPTEALALLGRDDESWVDIAISRVVGDYVVSAFGELDAVDVLGRGFVERCGLVKFGYHGVPGVVVLVGEVEVV